ncbi:MAG: hypothetical protein CMP11_02945 [Zetaproteobacteria bacterium]|nr:hypothetical protein [Pseudobdellovibrionaceae bacterium]|tara:strand:+ start:109 stop:693 length:585 start_codon:yes stop_codon:yes gene_type:complete
MTKILIIALFFFNFTLFGSSQRRKGESEKNLYNDSSQRVSSKTRKNNNEFNSTPSREYLRNMYKELNIFLSPEKIKDFAINESVYFNYFKQNYNQNLKHLTESQLQKLCSQKNLFFNALNNYLPYYSIGPFEIQSLIRSAIFIFYSIEISLSFRIKEREGGNISDILRRINGYNIKEGYTDLFHFNFEHFHNKL